ncbi:MAG: response regulator transcription factor [Chloroflexota bacterium]|nr:response regulator transcription factor [Ardenticatenaceae bacterium]
MRIMIADDQAKVRFALRILLEQRPSWHVVGEVGDADTLLQQIDDVHPDLLLLDWKLPAHSPALFLQQLRAICPQLMVVAISGRPECYQEAMRGGADAFVSKIDPPERLLAVLDDCVQHK